MLKFRGIGSEFSACNRPVYPCIIGVVLNPIANATRGNAMPTLNIKPTHKPIKNYYAELEAYAKIGAEHEGAVRTAFQTLLQHYSRQADLILVCEKTRYTKENRRIQLDGEVVDAFDLPHGHWEAKDTQDDLPTEARRKSEAGYPFKNIIIQSPTRALLYQNGHLRLDHDVTDPKNLIELLNTFFVYQEENIVDWYAAVEEFREKVPVLGRGVAQRVETEMQDNPLFRQAFGNFHQQCRAAIDPNLTEAQGVSRKPQARLTTYPFCRRFLDVCKGRGAVGRPTHQLRIPTRI